MHLPSPYSVIPMSGRPNQGQRPILLAALCGELLFSGPVVANPLLTPEIIDRAVEQRACFETYWWDRRATLGRTIPVSIRSTDDVAFVWMNNLVSLPHVREMVSYF